MIDNALKFSEKSPEINIKSERASNGLKIQISDNSIGIEKKYLNKIFDTFYRVPKGNIHNVKGHGIGLSYVKKMIEAHDGTIVVESDTNVGSIFTIFIPDENK